jgi:hypothetical protein
MSSRCRRCFRCTSNCRAGVLTRRRNLPGGSHGNRLPEPILKFCLTYPLTCFEGLRIMAAFVVSELFHVRRGGITRVQRRGVCAMKFNFQHYFRRYRTRGRLRVEFPLFPRHFHSRNLLEPLAFSLVESSIAFNGRAIFQRGKRTNGHLRESVTRLGPGNWKQVAVESFLRRE